MVNGIKYRIKQVGNKYYPQYKKILFWRYINVRTCVSNSYGTIINYYNEKERIYCTSYEKANKQITNYINNYLRPFWCLGHLVKTYFNKGNSVYYYVDVVKENKLYSDNAEQICELITLWEDDRKNQCKIEKQKRDAANKVIIHKYVED